METYFENEVTYTENVIYECIKTVHKSYKRLLKWVMSLLFLLLALINAFSGFIVAAVILLAVSLVLFAFSTLLFKYISKSNTQQLKIRNNGNYMKRIIEFGDEKIQVLSSNKAESTFNYQMITFVEETNNLIIMTIDPSLYIILDKNNFTVGSIYSFREFISEQCTKVRLKNDD